MEGAGGWATRRPGWSACRRRPASIVLPRRACAGWMVLRVTTAMLQDGRALNLLEQTFRLSVDRAGF
jgi:hypothetical protein